ncbi:MAG: DUF2158 domain-containing protein [Planktomarina sp.]|nr:DUF2158 domain-containing protein [Planktomarina sp.]
MKVELGSAVYLKSGGPLMTVEELGEHADARRAWFVDLAVQREWFALAALQPQDPPKAGVASSEKKVVK